MKLDVLALAAHPDDAELSCGGTLAKLAAMGHAVGIVDLTRGELGTRGTPELRAQEAAAASKILGLVVRENLSLPDGHLQNVPDQQKAVIQVIRRYQPEVVLTNAPTDRHPDHERAAELIRHSCFLAGLVNLPTEHDGLLQLPWRPRHVFHFIQDRWLTPDFIVPIDAHWPTKEAAIRAYKSQFHDPNSTEPETYISSPAFLTYIKARAQEFGHHIGTRYGEGFLKTAPLGVESPLVFV